MRGGAAGGAPQGGRGRAACLHGWPARPQALVARAAHLPAPTTRRYASWTESQVKASEASFVAVLYASAYGNTASLAQAISHGITKAGVGVETLNLEAAGLEELEGVLNRCSGFVLGSPTLGGHIPTQVQTALGTIISNANARQVPLLRVWLLWLVRRGGGQDGEAAQGAGPLSDEGRTGSRWEPLGAADHQPSACCHPPPPHPIRPSQDGGFRIAFDPIRCKFKPTAQTLQVCEESGLDLAQEIKKAAKRKEKQAAEKLSGA